MERIVIYYVNIILVWQKNHIYIMISPSSGIPLHQFNNTGIEINLLLVRLKFRGINMLDQFSIQSFKDIPGHEMQHSETLNFG